MLLNSSDDRVRLLSTNSPNADPQKPILADHNLSTPLQSYLNSVKIFLGNVYLTIPNVFSHTGYLGGIMLYTLVAALNTYTMTNILEVVE